MSDPIRSSGRMSRGKKGRRRGGPSNEYTRWRQARDADLSAEKAAAGQVEATDVPILGTRSSGYKAKAARRKVWPRLR